MVKKRKISRSLWCLLQDVLEIWRHFVESKISPFIKLNCSLQIYRWCYVLLHIYFQCDRIINLASLLQVVAGAANTLYFIILEIRSGRASSFQKFYFTFNQYPLWRINPSLERHPVIEYIFSFLVVLFLTVTQISGNAVILAVCNLVCLLNYKVGEESLLLIERSRKNPDKVCHAYL